MEDHDHIRQSKDDHDLLVRIDERTKTLSSDFLDFKNKLIPQFTDYENRIRSLEKAKWTWAGAVTALGSLGGWFLNSFFR
jgi:hypothetical protein